MMKKITISLAIFYILISFCAEVQAENYGKIRALSQRAAYVVKQKNNFIDRVLTSYRIPHKVNEQGSVIQIKMDNEWLQVTVIEIVPVFVEVTNKGHQVTAHELYFFTPKGILNVVSELSIP